MNKLISTFLIGEAITSILFSKDQRQISNIGRTTRIIIGTTLL